jgi:hypothetical protein
MYSYMVTYWFQRGIKKNILTRQIFNTLYLTLTDKSTYNVLIKSTNLFILR